MLRAAVVVAALAFAGSATAAPCLDARTTGSGVTVYAVVYRDSWDKPKTCKGVYCQALVQVVSKSNWTYKHTLGLHPCSRQVVIDVGPPSDIGPGV